MRITNKMMHNTMLRNLNQGLSRMDGINGQLSSGKRIQLPSDNPVDTVKIMQLRTSLNETEQFISNVEDGMSWLDSTDSALGEVTAVLHRARELAVYGASDTLEESSRDAIAAEIDQLLENVGQLANSNHGGRYLFSGQSTQQQPYSAAGGYNYEGDHGPIRHEISPGSTLEVNIHGDKVFSFDVAGTEHSIFQVLQGMADDLRNGDTAMLGNERLQQLDGALEAILSGRAEVGAKHNRLELAHNRLEDLKVNFSSLFGKVHDVDVAEAIMDLKAAENIYRTALSVGARIIQPSLVDFLR